jgi:hypothetical protein
MVSPSGSGIVTHSTQIHISEKKHNTLTQSYTNNKGHITHSEYNESYSCIRPCRPIGS